MKAGSKGTKIFSLVGKITNTGLVEALSETAIEASRCALGKSAPNPFLSMLRYFRVHRARSKYWLAYFRQ